MENADYATFVLLSLEYAVLYGQWLFWYWHRGSSFYTDIREKRYKILFIKPLKNSQLKHFTQLTVLPVFQYWSIYLQKKFGIVFYKRILYDVYMESVSRLFKEGKEILIWIKKQEKQKYFSYLSALFYLQDVVRKKKQ